MLRKIVRGMKTPLPDKSVVLVSGHSGVILEPLEGKIVCATFPCLLGLSVLHALQIVCTELSGLLGKELRESRGTLVRPEAGLAQFLTHKFTQLSTHNLESMQYKEELTLKLAAQRARVSIVRMNLTRKLTIHTHTHTHTLSPNKQGKVDKLSY